MNREILFRAKKIDDGKWIDGYLFDDGYPKPRHVFVGGLVINEYKGTACDEWDINAIDFADVKPDTICQYTGLTDKNGKKIFEGDILRGFQYPFCHDEEYNYYAEIIFANCSFMIYTHKNPSSCVRGISDGNTELMECWVSEDWEVIGNIYDDPELLEDKENSNGKNI
jgi:uncharacterized phage protein (TIGR01671 family)